MLRLFISLSVLAAVASAYCAGGIPAAEVKAFLETHNKLRASISAGTYVAKNKTLPAAKTQIPAMTWDCELEQNAQKVADKCKWEHSKELDDGENFYKGGTYGGITGHAAIASKMWEAEFQQHGLADTKFTMETYQSGVGHATQMAWAKSTKLGCGMVLCKGGYEVLVACHYRDGGNMLGANIYEN